MSSIEHPLLIDKILNENSNKILEKKFVPIEQSVMHTLFKLFNTPKILIFYLPFHIFFTYKLY